MDVMRTACQGAGLHPAGKEGHTVSGARDIADKLLALLSFILLYWYHYSHNGERNHGKPTMTYRRVISCICRTVKSQPKAGKVMMYYFAGAVCRA